MISLVSCRHPPMFPRCDPSNRLPRPCVRSILSVSWRVFTNCYCYNCSVGVTAGKSCWCWRCHRLLIRAVLDARFQIGYLRETSTSYPFARPIILAPYPIPACICGAAAPSCTDSTSASCCFVYGLALGPIHRE